MNSAPEPENSRSGPFAGRTSPPPLPRDRPEQPRTFDYRGEAEARLKPVAACLTLLAALTIVGQIITPFHWRDLLQSDDPLDHQFFWQLAISAVVQTLVSLAIVAAGVSMFRLSSYRLARIGAALAIVPCLSPMFVVGIPFGIWGWSVLSDPDVRRQFASERQSPPAGTA